jgi:hypothetical protein
LALLILVNVTVLLVVYFGYAVFESYGIYRSLKTPRRGWSGQVHRVDPKLGFAPVSSARGAHIFPIGPELPMRYDREGFRIPVGAQESQLRRRPLLLALGGSFTYGDATPAEKTYPYRIAQALDGGVINAGVCGYGLSQMLILARRLVPEHRPDYLLVQYSPWLWQRAVSPFAPSYYGKLTSPYFYRDGGRLGLHPPAFPAVLFDYPIGDYRASEASFGEFFAFVGEVGFPLVAREQLGMLSYHARRLLRILPRPADDHEAVIRAVYTEIAQIAIEQNARMIVVLLDKAGEEAHFPGAEANASFEVVDAQAALLSRLHPSNPGAFLRRYAHWRGDPPQLVDVHPNPRAHAIIAEAVIDAVRGEPVTDER